MGQRSDKHSMKKGWWEHVHTNDRGWLVSSYPSNVMHLDSVSLNY